MKSTLRSSLVQSLLITLAIGAQAAHSMTISCPEQRVAQGQSANLENTKAFEIHVTETPISLTIKTAASAEPIKMLVRREAGNLIAYSASEGLVYPKARIDLIEEKVSVARGTLSGGQTPIVRTDCSFQ